MQCNDDDNDNDEEEVVEAMRGDTTRCDVTRHKASRKSDQADKCHCDKRRPALIKKKKKKAVRLCTNLHCLLMLLLLFASTPPYRKAKEKKTMRCVIIVSFSQHWITIGE
uniref:Uncharacterized protein n=1 Tax=Caenorhabditis japonica TaxID=281687 RepID=A0A8R1IDU7_CAEJA